MTMALVACGGDDPEDPTAGSAEDQVAFAISEGATSNDPEKCVEFNTQEALERGYGGRGEAAIRACEATAGVGNAESVQVSNISVQGDSATAVVTVSGSQLDGQAVEMKLVKDQGGWKADRLLAFKTFDRSAMNSATEDVFRELGAPASARECILSQFEELSDEVVRNSFIHPPGPVGQMMKSCMPPLQ
jgi:hypothetical protein